MAFESIDEQLANESIICFPCTQQKQALNQTFRCESVCHLKLGFSPHVFQVMLGLFALKGLGLVDYLESTNPGTLEKVSLKKERKKENPINIKPFL